ncbi:AAA family ATPase [Parabacteroides sp. FAFU027]|uniref:cytidylate kinase-like family protein n=1 Tax=Parabacteroides sp. FAFU027 TaxID=2922715 RepID=UPI001FAF6D16|nr:cytidylate kinase-like family protein [Parabacteroides sp. FAFU027]
MENLLLKYMNERIGKAPLMSPPHPGPVITISRQCGCNANDVAEVLIEKINKIYAGSKTFVPWKHVSKEILAVASEELKMHPEKVEMLLDETEKNFAEELVLSFTDSYYAHGTKFKKVIGEVIRNIAVKGNVVIVGRASGIIAGDIPKSLHVQLEAPISWRTAMLSHRKNMSLIETRKYIDQVDKQRMAFRDHFKGKTSDKLEHDLSFNAQTLNADQIADLIIRAAEIRHLFD